MKISKTEAFFLNSVLFAFRTDANKVLQSYELEDLEDLEGRLRIYCLESSTGDHQSESSEDEEADEDEDDEPEESSTNKPHVPKFDVLLSDTELDKLPSVNVSYSDGATTSLEFECSNCPGTVDVILDSEIIPDVYAIKLSKESISIWVFEAGWQTFKFVKKSPKLWSRLLKADLVHGISNEKIPTISESSDEDE